LSFLTRISHIFFSSKETKPAKAYDLWSAQYDLQPDNLMLELDEQLVRNMLSQIRIEGRNVVDVGCGTGRHWQKFLEKKPARLAGYDVSAGMLQVLKQKFPSAEAYLIHENKLNEKARSCDVLVSTLTMAHIEEPEEAFAEWDRILKPGADIFITDYHPQTLAKGGKRTFSHKGKTVAVRNYVHFIEAIVAMTRQLHWEHISLTELKLDDSMKSWYEKQNAMHVFEKFKGTPLIYGLHLKKPDGIA
jgi:ubiquinone/menaquinone biosynthesis C-methylase UbiE